MAYSVGQIAYTTNSDTSGSVVQGVQHAYEIFTLGIMENDLDISVIIYPNPTAGELILQVNNYNNEQLQHQVYDNL